MTDPDLSPHLRTFFGVGGDALVPDAFSRALGLVPTRTQVKGQPLISGLPQPARFNLWEVEFSSRGAVHLEEPFERLLAYLWPDREAILTFGRDHGVTFQFSAEITIYGDDPCYRLSGATLRKMSFFGCGYAWDVYDFRD